MDNPAAAQDCGQIIDRPSPLAWLDSHADSLACTVTPRPIDQLDEWSIGHPPDHLRRRSGGFFTIRSIDVSIHYGAPRRWRQPVVEQFEIGLLGVMVRRGPEGLEMLIQAKGEPGDINGVQAAPTVQATRSNYRTRHQGRLPSFADTMFAAQGQAVTNCLQPEHGSFFLRKYNRNLAIPAPNWHADEHGANFRWMTTRDIASLLNHPNRVNMSLRSVLTSLFAEGQPAPLPDWFRAYAASGAIKLSRSAWHPDAGPAIGIIGVDVSGPAREVSRWQQPMLAGAAGRVDLLIRRGHEGDEFLLRAAPEPGHRKWLAMGPSWCSYASDAGDPVRAALGARIAELPGRILYDQLLSEDGGRFYRFQNRYRAREIEGDELGPLPPGYGWVPVSTLRGWIGAGLLTIELRSFLSWYLLRDTART